MGMPMHAGLGRGRPPAERASLRVVAGYVRPPWRPLLIGGLLSLATAATGLLLPLVVRALIDSLSHHRGLTGLIVLLSGLMLADAVLGSGGNYLLLRTGDTITLTARQGLVSRLLRIKVAALDRSEPGDLMARATVETTLLRNAVNNAGVPGTVGLLTMVAALVAMGLVDPILLLVALIAVAIIAAMEGLVMPRIGRATRRAQEAVGEMTAALERSFGAFRTVKAAGAESREEARVHAAASKAWRASLRSDFWQAVVGNTTELAIQFAFLAVLATGAAQVATHAISVGTLVAFLMYILFLMQPINQLVTALTQYQVGAAAVTRIEEAPQLPADPLGAAEPAAPEPPARETAAPGTGPLSVQFEDVRFSSRPDLPGAHQGVSFTIPPGGMTAFVGPSGAGKTTVFSLIERFYEPDAGRVLVGARDVRDWPLGSLREAIGYVEQDAPVLSGTLRENLLFGAPHATPADLDEVVGVARLRDLTTRLPEGLDTLVGHRGTRLSGGERQRVAIARALLRRPRLLLLDEATSQLDAINEAALRDTVTDVAQRITVLVVAHRLSTVTMADRIVVMDAARVQASGTHATLVATNPLYAELAATQFLATATPGN